MTTTIIWKLHFHIPVEVALSDFFQLTDFCLYFRILFVLTRGLGFRTRHLLAIERLHREALSIDARLDTGDQGQIL